MEDQLKARSIGENQPHKWETAIFLIFCCLDEISPATVSSDKTYNEPITENLYSFGHRLVTQKKQNNKKEQQGKC